MAICTHCIYHDPHLGECRKSAKPDARGVCFKYRPYIDGVTIKILAEELKKTDTSGMFDFSDLPYAFEKLRKRYSVPDICLKCDQHLLYPNSVCEFMDEARMHPVFCQNKPESTDGNA